MTTFRRQLTLAALDVARLLNTVLDDDERDLLHGHVEKVINDELYAGSLNRAQVAPVVAVVDLFGLFDRVRRSRAIDIFSRRVPKESA